MINFVNSKAANDFPVWSDTLSMFMNPVFNGNLAERVRRLFGKSPSRLQVAALPWRKSGDGIEVLLITSRDTGRWILPKGWPEGAEEFCDAAAREAVEEAGLAGAVSRSEVGRYFYSKTLASGEEVACEVLVYPLEVATVSGKWKEKHQRSRRWVSPAQAARMINEPDLCKLIAAFCADPRKFA